MFYLVAKTTNAETGEPQVVVLALSSATRVAAIKEAETTYGPLAVASRYRTNWTVAQAETTDVALQVFS